MATYFVAAGGSNTSPYETWAKAATSFQTALTAASTDGDIVVIQYNDVPAADTEVSGDKTYSLAARIDIISASNGGGSSYTPTVMGTSNWIGNSTTNRYVRIAPTTGYRAYGLTLRCAGTTLDSLSPVYAVGGYGELDSCYLWHSGDVVGTVFTSSNTTFHRLINCTFRFGNTGQYISGGNGEFINCSVSSDGTIPTSLVIPTTGVRVNFIGCDLSNINTTIVGDMTNGTATRVTLDRCKLHSSATMLAAQTTIQTRGGVQVWVLDSSSGDNHYVLGHYDPCGETVCGTGVYANDNICDVDLSWKITTTAYATLRTPYFAPPISVYHSGTSAITPYIEILRKASTTAYQDDEVYSTWIYKATSGYPIASINDEGVALLGTPANLTSSSKTASDWTGEDETNNWFGKLQPSAAITPAEAGNITANIYVSEPSITVYVDPQIRGLS